MTLESMTNSVSPPVTRSGRRSTRGSTRGTLTMAISLLRPKASLPFSCTMKLSDLLATSGNGCAGSSATGTSSGLTSRKKYSRTHLRCASVRSMCETMRMRWVAIAGSSTSL